MNKSRIIRITIVVVVVVAVAALVYFGGASLMGMIQSHMSQMQ